MFYNCTYISHRMGFFKVGLWFSSESTSLNVTFWVQNKKKCVFESNISQSGVKILVIQLIDVILIQLRADWLPI